MRFWLFTIFLGVFDLCAQTPLGTVSGLAIDASGGAVTLAPVTLYNNDSGVRRSTATNPSGAYAFPDLPPGTYRLEGREIDEALAGQTATRRRLTPDSRAGVLSAAVSSSDNLNCTTTKLSEL